MIEWKEGEEVEAIRIFKTWRLSKRDADEMNEGENPLYPWAVDRFQRTDAAAVIHPLYPEGLPAVHISTVLRSLASQEGCDGEPYDQMMQAANYIDHLEQVIREQERKNE